MPSLKHDYDRLVADLIVQLPGASEAGINQAMFNVFKDFFDYTGSWEEDITVAVTSGATQIELVSPEFGEVYQLTVVRNSQGFPLQGWLSMDRSQLVLRNALNADDTLTVTVKKTVAQPKTRDGRSEIPDYILPVWGPVLLHGGIAELAAQKGKPYSDPSLSAFHNRKYEAGKQNARSAVRHGYLYSGQTWRFPNTFRTRSQRNSANWTPPQ